MNNKPEKSIKYCQVCLLHKEICICEIIEKISLQTRITLILPQKELLRITNTGRLTSLCLTNHRIIEKKGTGTNYKPEEIRSDDYVNMILYPDAGQQLTKTFIEKLSKPVNLIVPDGTWRQTRKIFRTEKILHSITQVSLPKEDNDFNFVRKPQNDFYFSTFEAVIRALRIIEDEEVYKKLKNVLNEMITGLLRNNIKSRTKRE
ncbi:MAG: DTW domain-containing protein [Fibrobacteres bacterium]|nr:DTW domain-containing protein [Fibrobacterota bacterium]